MYGRCIRSSWKLIKCGAGIVGDSINLCGQIARTSDPNRIQISETTAQLIKAAGKDYWMSAREEDVVYRGQIPIRTYWLALFHFSGVHGFELTRSLDRMISWNVEVLSDFLKQVVAHRMNAVVPETEYLKTKDLEIKMLPHHRWGQVIDEVTEYIDLPRYEAERSIIDLSSFELDSVVKEQLHAFVTAIAERYNDNACKSIPCLQNVSQSMNHQQFITLNTRAMSCLLS
jgi:hypothetical protein